MRKMRSVVLQRQCKSSKDMFNSNFVKYLTQNLFHLYFQATNIPFYIWVLSQVLSLSIWKYTFIWDTDFCSMNLRTVLFLGIFFVVLSCILYPELLGLSLLISNKFLASLSGKNLAWNYVLFASTNLNKNLIEKYILFPRKLRNVGKLETWNKIFLYNVRSNKTCRDFIRFIRY